MDPDDTKFTKEDKEKLVDIINMYAKMVEDHPNLPPEVYELVYESIFKDDLGMSNVTQEDVDNVVSEELENKGFKNLLSDLSSMKIHDFTVSMIDTDDYVINDSDHYEVEMVENPLEAPSTLEDLENDIYLASERENWALVDELLEKRSEMLESL